MHQASLDGIPQPPSAPKRRPGRKPLEPSERPIGKTDVNLYAEDEEALEVLRRAGYRGTRSAILRQAARDQAKAVAQRLASPEKDGRLAL